MHLVIYYLFIQLRSFRIQFARALQYNAILAKLLEEESSDTGPNKDRDLELIKVVQTSTTIL